MNTKLCEKANEMIRTFEYASFGVIDENGYPSVSAISLLNWTRSKKSVPNWHPLLIAK
jgi:hypothetical protein